MKTVSDWIKKLSQFNECGFCGSKNVYPVITPYPAKYTSDIYKEANSKRWIMITCNNCGAVGSIGAEELEN